MTAELTEQDIESFRMLMQGPSPDKTSAVIQKLDALCDAALSHVLGREPVAKFTLEKGCLTGSTMSAGLTGEFWVFPAPCSLPTPQPSYRDGLLAAAKLCEQLTYHSGGYIATELRALAEKERDNLKKDVAHWMRMYECAQNANALRQSAMQGKEEVK